MKICSLISLRMSQSKMTTKKFISVTFKVQELEKVHTFVLLVYAVYVTACQNWYLLRVKIAPFRVSFENSRQALYMYTSQFYEIPQSGGGAMVYSSPGPCHYGFSTLSLSTQVYKWVPATYFWGYTQFCNGLASHPGGSSSAL